MSFQALNFILGLKVDCPRDKFVLFALANYADDNGMSYPSIKSIIKVTQFNRATVQRALTSLEDAGYIKRVRRTDMTGRELSQKYNIDIKGGSQSATPPAAQSDPPCRTERPPTYSTSTSNSTIGNNIRHNARHAREVIENGFNLFWEHYPSRRPYPNNKKTAFDKFTVQIKLLMTKRKIDEREAVDFMVKCVLNFATECAQNISDSQYIPMTATWLNQQRYFESVDPPAQTAISKSKMQG